ncbi:hypothetical protein AXG93_1219s1100 [Marchantia polymorpha subsp. ruderalis]|uniref:Uncharacterized protein n=1 Tax=Marchantia polymorpha subsp. ruderalis TaxID=1480154 RepID=A0A176VH71_MARPO|nr:hypothetical protein AXG93_1219s1100 [Marchantia polymorpha subsp. ruderalis]
MGPCVGSDRDLVFEKSSVGLTCTEEFSYGPLFSSGRQGTNGWKTTDYIDPKRRAIALGIMHILRPAIQRECVRSVDRTIGQSSHFLLGDFYRGMGLLTREEKKRFPKEREILTIKSSKGTEDNTRRPFIPPQTIAQGPVQVEVVRRRGKVGETSGEEKEKTLAEPLKEGMERVSPNSLSLDRTQTAGSEGIPHPKKSKELVNELTLSDEVLEQIVAQVGGTVVDDSNSALSSSPTGEVRPAKEAKTSQEEPEELVVSFPDFLQDSVVPLLKYLDGKREKYVVSKEESGRCAELEETCGGLRNSNENGQKMTVDLLTRLDKSKEAYDEAVKRLERLITCGEAREETYQGTCYIGGPKS